MISQVSMMVCFAVLGIVCVYYLGTVQYGDGDNDGDNYELHLT